MASNWVRVGGVSDTTGGYGIVHRCSETGAVSLTLTRNEVLFDAPGAIGLAELLQRAAMPGQPDGRPCCPHCDHGDGPDAHDPGDPVAHDGPCPSCQPQAAGHG